MIWLWILGILVLLGILICRTRLGIRAAFGGETATADLTIGPFRIRLAPRKTAPKKEKKPKKEPEKKPKKDASDLLKKLPKITLADIREAVDAMAPACKRALRRTRRSIRVDPLELSLTIAGAQDPAAAAELYGYVHTAVWTGMPVLEQLLAIPDPRIHIGLDFDSEKTRAEGRFGISIRIGTLMAVGIGLAVPALRWFLKFRKKKQQSPPLKTEEKAPKDNTTAA